MFRLFINKHNLGNDVKSIFEKISTCNEKFSELMYSKICLKNQKISQEDIASMEKEVSQLYDLIMNSPNRIRKYVIAEIFQFEIKLDYLTLERFFEQIKANALVTLVKDGRLRI